MVIILDNVMYGEWVSMILVVGVVVLIFIVMLVIMYG